MTKGLPSTYYNIKNTKAMKAYFFNYINKIVISQNRYILSDRNFIKEIYPIKDTISKDSEDHKRFLQITKRYKLKSNNKLKQYLFYIDIIPSSLVLAQAAIESGWGKSRFIKKANNIFGQWTWSGKGLAPSNRDAHLKHKIKIFSSLDASVRGYMINLNLGWGYKEFRKLRSRLRQDNHIISGKVLARTLINYSQKKEQYTRILDKIIRINKLEDFDK